MRLRVLTAWALLSAVAAVGGADDSWPKEIAFEQGSGVGVPPKCYLPVNLLFDESSQFFEFWRQNTMIILAPGIRGNAAGPHRQSLRQGSRSPRAGPAL